MKHCWMCRFEFLTFPNYNSISFSVIWKKVFSSPGYQVHHNGSNIHPELIPDPVHWTTCIIKPCTWFLKHRGFMKLRSANSCHELTKNPLHNTTRSGPYQRQTSSNSHKRSCKRSKTCSLQLQVANTFGTNWESYHSKIIKAKFAVAGLVLKSQAI